MSRLRRFFSRLSNVVRPARAERELAREVASHLSLLQEELERRGMTPEDAHVAARRALGGIEQAKELHRDERSFVWLDEARRDVQYALRSLGRTPGFTAAAVLTLALGIGANTAIFSVVNGVLLKPLPYKDSDRLVTLIANVPAAESDAGTPTRTDGEINASELTEIRSRAKTLARVSFRSVGALMTMTGRGETIRLEGMSVFPGIFDMLGARPLVGRTLRAGDEAPGRGGVIVLSYATWRRYFGADPHILGQTLTLSNRLARPGERSSKGYSVVGVMPDGFAFEGLEFHNVPAQFWIPRGWNDESYRSMIARLADGVSLQAATAEIDAMLRAIRKDRQLTTYELVRLQDEVTEPVKPALRVLTVAVGFVLLIACANVANLLLARTAARQREIAIRIALGAGRARVIRQLLTESIILALFGGVSGTVLAFGGVHLLRMLVPTLSRMDLGFAPPFPRLDAIGVDASVLVFTAAASLLAGLLFGLAPAMRHARPDQMGVLREGGAPAASGFGHFRRFRLRGALVVAQVAMAMTLLAGGGLLIRSFVKLSRVDAGYDPTNVLTFEAALPPERYPATRVNAFAENLVARLRLVPGVESAAYARQLPMVILRETMAFEREPTATAASRSESSPYDPRHPKGDFRMVSPNYLETMGVRVIAGRGFNESDRTSRPGALIINQAMAHRYFPGENPIGKLIETGQGLFEVICIVEDVRQFGLDQAPTPQYFVTFHHWLDETNGFPVFPVGPYYVVRTVASRTSFLSSLRNIVRELDAEAGLYNVVTMQEIVSNSTSRPRMYATLLGIFSAVSLCLAAIGLYGVMAYSVTQRTREIGLRMALGAQRAQVMNLVLRQSLVLTSVGIVLGLAGAAAVTQYLEGMLFGLTPLDPPTFIAGSLMLAGVAMLAAYVPARRATRVDPLIALRQE